jgi:hypothetical protein
MGGKRAYSDDVLRIIGEHPRAWHMVDADPAIVLWWSAVFDGWLDEVAARIRAYELDGEELWRSIVYANGKNGKGGPAQVPVDPVDRLAAWLIGQKGNFSAKPLGWNPSAFTGDQRWKGTAGFMKQGPAALAAGFPASTVNRDPMADKVAAWQGVAGFRSLPPQAWGKSSVEAEKIAGSVAAWQGVAGYKHVSKAGRAKGFPDSVIREAIARATAMPRLQGAATFADLSTWAPDFQPGDLVTIDPPYAGTTGYGEVLPRDRVVELALMADTAGARVIVHEAEPVIESGASSWRLEALYPHICPPERWRSLDLRKGERRNQDTWRKRGRNGAREVVTINFEPAGRLGEQVPLFALGQPMEATA